MNRDQYLQKKDWRALPVVTRPAQLAAQAMQGGPPPQAGSPQAVLAAAPVPAGAAIVIVVEAATRDSLPPLRQKPIPPGAKD